VVISHAVSATVLFNIKVNGFKSEGLQNHTEINL